MSRLRLVSVMVGLAIVLAGPTAAAGAPSGNALGHTIRFDVIQFTEDGVILAGGSALAEDDFTGDTVAVTATGQFKPGTGDAAGGGTFRHHHAAGGADTTGVWIADGVASWKTAHGNLAGFGLTDGIGHLGDVTGGIVFLNVTLFPDGGPSLPAVLGIHCVLEDGTDPSIEEGISVEVGPFDFEQVEGATLFHVLG